MTVGVLALQGDFEAHVRALARLGVAAVEVRKPAELEATDALILPGGESTTMLKLLAQDQFETHLHTFVRSKPTFATCAGAILLARKAAHPEQRSLGVLDLTAVRNAYGRQIESSIRDATVCPAFVSSLGTTIEAVLIRAPQFEELGPGVEIVAQAAGLPVLVRQGHILAASFHPELSEQSPVHGWFLQIAGSGLGK